VPPLKRRAAAGAICAAGAPTPRRTSHHSTRRRRRRPPTHSCHSALSGCGRVTRHAACATPACVRGVGELRANSRAPQLSQPSASLDLTPMPRLDDVAGTSTSTSSPMRATCCAASWREATAARAPPRWATRIGRSRRSTCRARASCARRPAEQGPRAAGAGATSDELAPGSCAVKPF
jgi:hypothetical protein